MAQSQAIQKNIQFISLKQRNLIQHHDIIKLASLPLVPFTLRSFSIRPIQDLGKVYKYGYFRIKESYEYGYSKVEKPHKYDYFRTKELYEYEYSIMKKLDGNILDRHNFQILVNCK